MLNLGDKFRPASDKQMSLNNRKMGQDKVFRITRIYPQTPNIVVSVLDDSPNKGIFSLGPGTPVLFPNEPNASEDEVREFLTPGRGKTRVTGYELLWDGKTEFHSSVPTYCQVFAKLMFAHGKEYYTASELGKLWIANADRYERHPSLILNWRSRLRQLVMLGILKEIRNTRPRTGPVVDANLQEVL